MWHGKLASMTQTVLIVDDHPSFLAVARLLLETDGFVVVGVATDGESGVAETLRLMPDVVLIDVGLPDVDGFEVAARLREAGASSAIILTSSREGSDFGPLIEDSGARGFVAKPELSGDAVRALVA
jgi:DNA-binding NarL/FixJ family response regulator